MGDGEDAVWLVTIDWAIHDLQSTQQGLEGLKEGEMNGVDVAG